MDLIVSVAISILGSSAVFGFIEFLIRRKDNKKDQMGKISDKIDKLSDKVDEKIDTLSKRVDDQDRKLRESLDLQEAINSRIRILRASDEIRHKVRHSKEWFDQVNEDITYYERYCSAHVEFKNNRAVQAISVINKIYTKALEENDFLE